jgi:hypothetical protein
MRDTPTTVKRRAIDVCLTIIGQVAFVAAFLLATMRRRRRRVT